MQAAIGGISLKGELDPECSQRYIEATDEGRTRGRDHAGVIGPRNEISARSWWTSFHARPWF